MSSNIKNLRRKMLMGIDLGHLIGEFIDHRKLIISITSSLH